jgi:hypothetical protein
LLDILLYPDGFVRWFVYQTLDIVPLAVLVFVLLIHYCKTILEEQSAQKWLKKVLLGLTELCKSMVFKSVFLQGFGAAQEAPS